MNRIQMGSQFFCKEKDFVRQERGNYGTTESRTICSWSGTTNCYFAINDDTKEVLVIDPGASADQLAKKIRQEKLIPIAILLTHGHFDHAGGAEELAKHFDIKIYAEEHEKETLDTPSLNLSGWEGYKRPIMRMYF